MSESFDCFDVEEERIEICDDDGLRLVYRPLAAFSDGDEMYYVFGAVKEMDDENLRQLRLMLVRREKDDAGESRYVICEDERDVQRIIGSFVRDLIESMTKEMAQVEEDEGEEAAACDRIHPAGEFCYCNRPEYLQ